MSETYLTVEQAAARLQIAPYTLRNWLKTGRVSGVKIGRLWRVPPSALEHLQSTPSVAGAVASLRRNKKNASIRSSSASDAVSQLARFDQFLNFAASATRKTKPLADDAIDRAYREREDKQT